MVKPINQDLLNISLLIGVKNPSIEEHLQFLYDIVSVLEAEGRLNDDFTKLEIKKRVSSTLSFVNGDVGDYLEWMVNNTPYLYITNDRSAGANHYKLKGHPWE